MTGCVACCFFRLVETKNKHNRKLCMLTGEKRPIRGISGCKFVPGQWNQLDLILDLPKSRDCGTLNFPNHTKPVTAYFHKEENVAKLQNIAIDDFSENPIDHIAEKLEGSLVRPGTRKGQVARMARERAGCLFHV